MVHFYGALRPNPDQCAAFPQFYIFNDQCAAFLQFYIFNDQCAAFPQLYIFNDQCAAFPQFYIFNDQCAAFPQFYIFNDQCAAFPQLYIFNTAESLRTRRDTFHGVLKDSVTLDILTTLEDIENPYISAYRTMYNIEQP